jgi:hypothetical protein
VKFTDGYRKCVLPLFLCLLCAPLAGCPSQNQGAALIGIAGTAIASLETIEGHGDLAAQIQSDFSAAQTAVLNWKAGTPTQDVHQVLAIVVNDLNLLPVSQQTQEYIILAVGTVQAVLDLFPGTDPQFATTARATRVRIVAPHSKAEFIQTWNNLPGHLAPLPMK